MKIAIRMPQFTPEAVEQNQKLLELIRRRRIQGYPK